MEIINFVQGTILEHGYGIVAKDVLRDKKLSIQAKALYAYLCSYAGRDNKAFPSTEKISSDLNISTRSLYKYLKELKDLKYISVSQEREEDGTFSRNVYNIEMMRPSTPNDVSKQTYEKSSKDLNSERREDGGASSGELTEVLSYSNNPNDNKPSAFSPYTDKLPIVSPSVISPHAARPTTVSPYDVKCNTINTINNKNTNYKKTINIKEYEPIGGLANGRNRYSTGNKQGFRACTLIKTKYPDIDIDNPEKYGLR
jgi:hypothetical protein